MASAYPRRQQRRPQHRAAVSQAQAAASLVALCALPRACTAQTAATLGAAPAAGAPTPAPAPQGIVIGDHVPTERPGPGWPAATAAASNAAWPSGQQPMRLWSWPQTGAGTKDPVLHACWKQTVLQDVSQGWPDVCLNLMNDPDRGTMPVCKATCMMEPRCPVWQFLNVPGTGQGTGQQCWLGAGTDCDSSTSNANLAVEVLGGQRLQHGEVMVLKNMSGPLVTNLYNLGPYTTGTEEQNIQRCRSWCYSLLTCQYWQYGSTGCWVDAPYLSSQKGMLPTRMVEYPLTTTGLSSVVTMGAGEYIVHYCPPAPPPAAPGSLPATGSVAASAASWTTSQGTPPSPADSGGSGVWIWGGIAVVLIIAGLVVAGYFSPVCSGQRKASKPRGSRQASESDDEDYDEADGPEDSRPLISDDARDGGGEAEQGPLSRDARAHGVYGGGGPAPPGPLSGHGGGQQFGYGGPPGHGPGAPPGGWHASSGHPGGLGPPAPLRPTSLPPSPYGGHMAPPPPGSYGGQAYLHQYVV